MSFRASLIALALPLMFGCAAMSGHDGGEGSNVDQGDQLTGVTSSERAIHFQSYVYVPTDASDDAIDAYLR